MKPQRTFSGMLMLGLLLLFTASLSLAREKGPDDAMLEGSSSQTTGPDVADPGTVRTSPRGIPLEARGTRDQGSPQTLNWQIETVDDVGDVGQYTSLSLTSKDEPYVSYYDVGNEALKVAYLDGSTWDIDVVHSDPFYGYGEYTSGAGFLRPTPRQLLQRPRQLPPVRLLGWGRLDGRDGGLEWRAVYLPRHRRR